MSENFEMDKLELKAIDALNDVLEEIREAERKRVENGIEKYISDAAHEKLYELWDAFDYYVKEMTYSGKEECFGVGYWGDIYDSGLSPEEFIKKINNYILKKNKKQEKDSKEIVEGDEIEVHFYGEYEHLNDFLTEDDKHLYYFEATSDGYVKAFSKSGASTKTRVDCVKKTGKHYKSFTEFINDNT